MTTAQEIATTVREVDVFRRQVLWELIQYHPSSRLDGSKLRLSTVLKWSNYVDQEIKWLNDEYDRLNDAVGT